MCGVLKKPFKIQKRELHAKMEEINSILSGILLPIILVASGIYFAARLRFFYILHPIRTWNCLWEGGKNGGVSPFRALTVALAGTLGVGNMAGVATAITAGGAGALFWMWISALCAMSIKYVEVRLAIETREYTEAGWRGGAMYYIRRIIHGRWGKLLASSFALMCAANSLLTGTIVQVNSACAAFESVPSLYIGIPMGICAVWITAGGGKRVSNATVILIPLLSAIYIALSLAIIFNNAERLPEILREIISGAFSLSSVGGGIGGFAMTRAMRFGVTRGIFSNEAGCGTSPTAHAMAETKSSHHSGCFGIFEVFADTMILCTMTGFVILLSDMPSLDGIPLTLYAFRTLAGEWASHIIAISVILFALSTVISQSTYAIVSLEYLKRPAVKILYYVLIFAASIWGSIMSPSFMWQMADLVIGLMTVINIFALLKNKKEHFPKRNVPSVR